MKNNGKIIKRINIYLHKELSIGFISPIPNKIFVIFDIFEEDLLICLNHKNANLRKILICQHSESFILCVNRINNN